MSSRIDLYTGPGTSPFCIESLDRQIKNILDDRVYIIRHISDFSGFLSDPRFTSAFIFPGGSLMHILFDTPLKTIAPIVGALKRERISYYGSCVGGILAAEHIFGRASDNFVKDGFIHRKDPLLGIFPADTIAPLFPRPISKKPSLADFRLISVLDSHQGSSIPIPHLLGPAYKTSEKVRDIEILTRYETLPEMQFVSCRGPGDFQKVSVIDPSTLFDSAFYQSEETPPTVITSTHPEIDSQTIHSTSFREAFSATKADLQKLSDELAISDMARSALLEMHLKKLTLKTKSDS